MSLAAPVAAASPQPELLLFEEPPITAAVKHSQKTSAAPSDVSVVSAEDIRRYGFRTLGEALRSVRGFYLSNDRNYTALGVRGFQRPSDYNDRILVLLNGHATNDDVFQQAFVGNELGIDLEAVQRIEVIRGPGSALYGGNALFAVINIVTFSAAERPGLGVTAETGSFGRKRGQFSLGHTFANGAQFFASGSALDLDGHSSLYYPEYDSPETNDGVARNRDNETALNLYASGRYGDWSTQASINRRAKDIPTGAYDTIFNDAETATIDVRAFLETRYQRHLRRDVELDARFYLDYFDYDGTYPTAVDGTRVVNRDVASSYWYGTDIFATWSLADINRLTLGSEYSHHPDAEQRNYDRGDSDGFADERTFSIWGVYLQDELTLPYGVTLIGGLRYDDTYAGITQWNPRAAAVWNATDDTTFKVMYGTAFRAPNLYELYYATVGGGVESIPNPNLDPEEITSYEAFGEHWLQPQLRLIASVYHYEVHDLVDITDVSPDVQQYRNAGTARANGLELGGDWEIVADLGLHVRYTYEDAEGSHGSVLSNSPKHLGRVGTELPAWHGLEVATEVVVVGPRRTLAGHELSTVSLMNLNFIYHTPIDRLRLTTGFYNLFDASYSDPAGPEHRQDEIPQDGFTFRTQVAYGF